MDWSKSVKFLSDTSFMAWDGVDKLLDRIRITSIIPSNYQILNDPIEPLRPLESFQGDCYFESSCLDADCSKFYGSS